MAAAVRLSAYQSGIPAAVKPAIELEMKPRRDRFELRGSIVDSVIGVEGSGLRVVAFGEMDQNFPSLSTARL